MSAMGFYMKKDFIFRLAAIIFAASLLAACGSPREARQAREEPDVEGKNLAQISAALGAEKVDIWNGKPVGNVASAAEKIRGKYALTNISKPRLELFLLENGKSGNGFVIVCPGGGYSFLNGLHEGYGIAKRLNQMGVSAAVLWYRAPDNRKGALQDLLRSIRISRANAKLWNINPEKIAVMGFSAGADLAARASARYLKKEYAPVDEIDSLSARPDNTILVYPAYCDEPMYRMRWVESVMGDIPSVDYNTDYKLTPHLPVDKDTPPALIIQTLDDKMCKNSSLAYFLALKEAGVKANLFMCDTGGHGYGLCSSRPDLLVSAWPAVLEKYLQINGYIKK